MLPLCHSRPSDVKTSRGEGNPWFDFPRRAGTRLAGDDARGRIARWIHGVAVALGAAMLLCASAAFAQGDFYRGKTITLLISSSAGGGYDIMGRTLARHLGKHIPGNPRIVVTNMPGAGGITAMNYLYRAAPRDGTFIGGVQNNLPFEPLLGTKEAVYDPTKFNWLGSPSIEVGLIAVWHTAPVDTIEDLQQREITVGSSGANSTPSFYARLLNETLGTKMKIVVGYPGQNEVYFAMERGEVDGFPSLFYNTLNATRPNWRTENNIKLILQYGLEKEPALPDVPSALDLVTDPEDKQLLQAGLAQVTMGRPYLMPPGVPAERVAIMRRAFEDTFKDADFLADSNRLALGVETPRTGAQVQRLLEETYRTPPNLVARLRTLSLH
jgi:tripartite-type tricarboxylate transporter receptor subunit TctC